MPRYKIEIDDSSPDWVQVTVTEGDVFDAHRVAEWASLCIREQLGIPSARITSSVRVDGPLPVVTVRTHTLGMLLMGKPARALNGLLVAAGHQSEHTNRRPLTAEQKTRAASAKGQAAKLRPDSLD